MICPLVIVTSAASPPAPIGEGRRLATLSTMS
jgi:hypothetical protein